MRTKAVVVSSISALLLAAFLLVLEYREEFAPWVSATVTVVLIFMVAAPILFSGILAPKQRDTLLGELADVSEPAVKDFSFIVPTRPQLVKVQPIPTRLTITIGASITLLVLGKVFLMDLAASNGVPFEVFVAVIAGIGAFIIVLTAAFIVVTVQELNLRREFNTEVNDGVSDNGFEIVGGFDSANTASRDILLRDEENAHYWWGLHFDDCSAHMKWEPSNSIED